MASLECVPWKYFHIQYRDFVVKSSFGDSESSYEIYISDFKRLWFERVEGKDFLHRAKDDIIDDKKLVLRMKTKLQAGVPFVWEFHCTTKAPEHIFTHITHPLLAMVAELQRREQELCRMLTKKDAELADYKDSGYKLSRRNLETQVFNEEEFCKTMLLSPGFPECILHSARHCFSLSGQDLYQQIMSKKQCLQSAKEEASTHVLDGSEDLGPGAGVQRKSPVKSPKRPLPPSPDTLHSKELELQRQEELKKRLADEAERKKRKKKKIKL
ncbi:non-homologous end-joining factor 1 isoform X2 [Nematostella vectensis]|uniref:non-homologous end-joining factor 1 isoform X2 n=1 Tax=Nematostella vectensis TaxID=45351 RepID=UPI002076D6B6|nr:non-homologous end-joining factor 1 isoform X2 [Nematostella vectensis]